MSSSITTEPSKESQVMLETLKTAVAHALEKKRRLGQYAAVWQNGKPDRCWRQRSQTDLVARVLPH